MHEWLPARGLVTKHAVKQVDRLLSNVKPDVNFYFSDWVPYLVGSRKEIIVSMDWTEFDAFETTALRSRPKAPPKDCGAFLFRALDRWVGLQAQL